MIKKVTAEERDKINAVVDDYMHLRLGLDDALELVGIAKKVKWGRIMEVFPGATLLSHPQEGDWYVTVPDEPIPDESA